MATQRLRLKPPSPLSTEQKVAFGLLMFLGLGGVVFGAQSFGANMMRPIQEQIAAFYTGEEFLTSDEREAREMEESKIKDTDGDGLVDYDELYVYKTSPYIADSDSDGYDDKQEVYSGNNPNCPVGKTCNSWVSAAEEVNTQNDVANGFIQSLGDGKLLDAGSVQLDTPEDIENFFQELTLAQLRSALVAAGMPQEELDAIDDETLKQLVSDVVGESELSGSLNELLNTTGQ